MRVFKGVAVLALALAVGFGLQQLWQLVTRPAPEALAQEAMIFNAEDAQWFGEEPERRHRVAFAQPNSDVIPAQVAAVIDGVSRSVGEGDLLLAPCLRLAKILAEGVLLERCGAYQFLIFGEGGFDYRVGSLSRGIAGPLQMRDLRDDPSASALAAEYLERLYDAPLSLRGTVKVERQTSALGEREYYLYPGEDARLFTQLPLRSGDRLHAVNGIALSEGEALTELYGQLDQVRNITVTLIGQDGEVRVMLVSLPTTVSAVLASTKR